MELRYIHLTDAVSIINDPVSSSYALVADSGWLPQGVSSLRTVVLSDFDGTWELKVAQEGDYRVFSHEAGRWVDECDESRGTYGTLKWLKPGVRKKSTW